ncbi:receptor-type tyrosine-protein phosphatase F-like [Acanthaster planci]|uniref:Receptor-type tyrosine-protein phosphatase F-like n=1 Tax=Acanthaster planci TaxID=133434 RepID=A0A8B7Z7V4_ACAPL|nr:receptor-type tyrosine-protein phosphatase F-like [Acanthaster planci]
MIVFVVILSFLFAGVKGGTISLVQSSKPNAGQPVTLVCQADGSSSPPGPDALTLTGPQGSVTAMNTSVVDNTRSTSFEVTVDKPNVEFVCTLLDTDGTTVLNQTTINVDAFVLPYLRIPPQVSYTYSDPTKLTLNWLSWESNGGGDGPILRYEAVYRYANDTEGDDSYNFTRVVDSNVTTSVEITGLDPYTDYDFAVVVVREGVGGAGPPTNKTTIKTLCPAPTAPLTLSARRIELEEIEITWELPPPSTWGCGELAPKMFVEWKKSTAPSFSLLWVDREPGSYNLTLVAPCTEYYIQAWFASVSFLTSPKSEELHVTTPKTEPPAVASVYIEYVDDSLDLRVRWVDPSVRIRCIREFYVTFTPVELVACGTRIDSPVTRTMVVPVNSSSTGVVFGSLDPYMRYNATVMSSNELGNSTIKFETKVTRQTLPIALPAPGVVEVTQHMARLNWTRIPCVDVHGNFRYYSLQFTNNQTGETFDESETNIDITELSSRYINPCMTFNVQIYVVTGAGNGPRSEKMQFTTLSRIPTIVTNYNVIAIDDNTSALLVTWEDPDNPYCPVDFYQVSYSLLDKFQCDHDENREQVVAANTTVMNYTITGLLPYSTYKLYVRTHNEAGFSYSDGRIGVFYTAQRAPTDAPIRVTVESRTKNWLHFSFARADCSEGSWSSRLIDYRYRLDNVDNTSQPVVNDYIGTYVRFENLIPYTRYSFRVQMRTEAGNGPFSTPVEARTSEDVPGPPASLTVTNKTETTLDVAWETPTTPNGVILNYTVQYKAIEKPYDPTFSPPTMYTEAGLVGPAVFAYQVDFLDPGTKYRIRVAALTSPGEGEFVMHEAFTKPKTDIPEPDTPPHDPSRSSETSVYIYIHSTDPTYVTSFLVAVRKMLARQKRAAVVIDGESYGTYSENPDAYIAAEVEKKKNNGGFLVGDGKMYGGWQNAPLGKGNYSVRVGAKSEADSEAILSWSEPLMYEAMGPEPVTPSPTKRPGPKKTVPPPVANNTVGIIAGVVVGVLVVLIIVIGIAYWLKKKKEREVKDSDNEINMDLKEKDASY